MKSIPRISEAEWAIMKVLWQRSPMTAQDIINQLNIDHDWHPKTAKTLLNRLVKKGALSYEKQGRAYLYSPLVSEEESVRAVSESFLQRVFGGGLEPMLAHFVQGRKLSRKEVEKLKQILEGKE